jgi:ubiquilin
VVLFQGVGSSPADMQTMLQGMMGGLGAGAGTGAAGAGAAGAAGTEAMNPLAALMAGMGGLGGMGAGLGAPAPVADPATAYATQLQQLQVRRGKASEQY